MFTLAKTNANSILKSQQAGTQAIQNTGITNQRDLSGGVNYSTLMAKNGATLQFIRNYVKTRKNENKIPQNLNLVDETQKVEILKFKNGGNVITSGALHKNKHKLENVNPELKGEITKKGIPVISYAEKGDVLEFENDGKTPKVLAEGGEIIQHAEIEKEEIIFNLDVTKKLEELRERGTDEAAIAAGKLLTKEILENTVDKAGLIKTVE